MKQRKWIIFLLLISFGILLTPKNYWHSCDHTFSVEQKSSKELSFNKQNAHCFICKVDFSFQGLLPFTITKQIQLPLHFRTRSDFEQLIHSLYLFQTKRGPPSICS